MIETSRAEQWLYAVLNASPAVAGGRIYQGVAPQGAVAPYVVYQWMGGSDLMEVGAARVWADLLYLVKAVGKGESFAAVAPIADEIDTRLHDKSGAVSDARILACRREQPFQLSEAARGVHYRHAGGFYRLNVQPL